MTEESLRFRRHQRLHGRADFRRVFARRCSAADGRLVVYVDRSPVEQARIGVRAARRLGKAVARNRARRRLKEAFRLRQHDLPAVDMVVILRTVEGRVEDYAESLARLSTAAARKLTRVAK